MAANRGDRDLMGGRQKADHPMELAEHQPDLVTRMGRNIYSGREVLASATQDNHRRFMMALQFVQRILELVHHPEIDDVLAFMSERDARHRSVLLECDAGVSDCWLRVHKCTRIGPQRWLTRPKTVFIVLADSSQLF